MNRVILIVQAIGSIWRRIGATVLGKEEAPLGGIGAPTGIGGVPTAVGGVVLGTIGVFSGGFRGLTRSKSVFLGMRGVLLGITLALAMLMAPPAPARAQPCGEMLEIPNTLGGEYSEASGVSADGSVVVGYAYNGTGERCAFRWTAAGGMQEIPNTLGGTYSWAYDVSADGSVVVGLATNAAGEGRAFRWTVAGGMQEIPNTLGGLGGGAYGVSANGSVVVGGASNSGAFRWTVAGGMQEIPNTFGGDNSVAYGVSADGSVVVGYADNAVDQEYAFRWTAAGGMHLLFAPGPGGGKIASGVSADGAVVVGLGLYASGFRAFRWTAAGGAQDLGTLLGRTSSWATGVSADGTVVVGSAYNVVSFNQGRAFFWTAAGGMQDLGTLPGANYAAAHGVSADGSVVVGHSFNQQYEGRAFRWGGDTDGDGIPDDWECNGIPYTDTSGVAQRFPLPGADPMHKDLYVEVDAMTGFSLSSAAANLVVGTANPPRGFAGAPVSNPDGTTGITLHVFRDTTPVPHVAVWQTVAPEHCWPIGFTAVRSNPSYGFGTDSERSDPGLLAAKAKAYRYCIVADRAGPDNIGGCGQRPGDNFVVFFGSGTYNDEAQAAVFMHELGHNLGLQHGGGDGMQGKPNYPSIMNYTMSYRAMWNATFWRLDYSRVGPPGLANLDESSLNEMAGIGTAGGEYRNFMMPFGVNETIGGMTARTIRYVRLNGSATDFGNTTGSGFLDGLFTTGVAQDLNYAITTPPGVRLPVSASAGDMLHGFDDWARVNVGLTLAAALGPSAPVPSFPTDELTGEARDWINQNFPMPPGVCTADFNNDTFVNSQDFFDFLAAFFALQPAADFNHDTFINSQDFFDFLAAFFTGC